MAMDYTASSNEFSYRLLAHDFGLVGTDDASVGYDGRLIVQAKGLKRFTGFGWCSVKSEGPNEPKVTAAELAINSRRRQLEATFSLRVLVPVQ